MQPDKLRRNLNSLRTRFALGFSLLFTTILAVALIFIYVSFAKFRKEEFYTRLKEKAVTTYNLLVEVQRIDSSLLSEIDKNTPSSAQRQVMIFKDSSIIYNSSPDKKIQYDDALFAIIKDKKEDFTIQDKNEVLGMYMGKGKDNYTIMAYGYDNTGFRKMIFLKWVMIIVYCIGVILGCMAIYFFVRKIIRPLEVLKTNLKSIDNHNLDIRLPETGQGEEVDSLSVDFNQMLARLDQSFKFQKDFVHYASHELRTPIAAMIGITENSLNSIKTTEQPYEVLTQLLYQQRGLADITNSLLLLSGTKINSTENEYPYIRLDELVFRSVEIMKNLFPDSIIEVDLGDEITNDSLLLIPANEPLILMAFNNLLKNAIQYSADRKVVVLINASEKERRINFINAGAPFKNGEEEKLFTPFYRSTNSAAIKGHGLGLSLVKQIAQLHKATVRYSFKEEKNIFSIIFP